MQDVLNLEANGAAERPRADAVDRKVWKTRITQVRREVRTKMDVSQFEGPDPLGSAALVISTFLVVGLAAGLTIAAWTMAGSLAAIVLYLLCLPAIARQQRALELLVHDGSHGAISRTRWLNDLLCDLGAGAPVMQLTSRYRLTHKVHHQQFGSDLDPCRDRSFMIHGGGDACLPRIRSVLDALPSYLRDYYGGVASTSWKPLVAAGCWHGAAIFAMSLLTGWTTAVSLWALFWLVPFVSVLPVIRMVAESDEHAYDQGCEAGGTFTNIGVINTLIVHPANDQFHLAHHAFSAIPISRLRRFDRMARRVSPLYAAMPVRNR